MVPYAVFITPELGRVGLTETEARAAGRNVRARMPVSAIPRARTIGELDGVWKAVVDSDTDLILGAALFSNCSSATPSWKRERTLNPHPLLSANWQQMTSNPGFDVICCQFALYEVWG
ncbi:hypothetical protein [Pseudarthrobacter sp. Y6]|uniref:hypothetical protein n=1 Tax=Pseudarthrobacter sp. Y6 TaxID=3418422 RepID=UPI003CF4E5BC